MKYDLLIGNILEAEASLLELALNLSGLYEYRVEFEEKSAKIDFIVALL